MAALKTNDHAAALMNIKKIIFSFGLPELTASMVPPIGVRKRGVNAATPTSPYLVQIATNFLLLPENLLCFFENLLVMFFRIHSPKKVKSKTTVIIPATVVKIVVTKFSPDAYPITGPNINFSILQKYT
jgi:hypothetical protein